MTKASFNLEVDLKWEAKPFAYKLKLTDRIEKFYIKNCFITLNYHESDFRIKPECRLINPSKTQMGKITNVILKDICETLRIVLNINLLHSNEDWIKLFKNYD